MAALFKDCDSLFLMSLDVSLFRHGAWNLITAAGNENKISASIVGQICARLRTSPIRFQARAKYCRFPFAAITGALRLGNR